MPTLGSDPKAFIRHNLLTLDSSLDNPAPALVRPDGTVLVTLQDVTGQYTTVKRNRNRKGLARLVPKTCETWWTKPASVYKVVPGQQGDPDSFAAYICPYQDNNTHTKMLGNDANVMFTGDMDGCTFGVGIPNANGDVLVGHSNAQNQAQGTQFNPDFAPQRAAQLGNLQNQNVAQMVVDPDVYRDNATQGREFKAVTVGLRVGNTWEFYYQHQEVDGMDWREKVATSKLQ